jgi:hypothetical protein
MVNNKGEESEAIGECKANLWVFISKLLNLFWDGEAEQQIEEA